MSVTLRYRESKKTGLFSTYLDIYENSKREYEYLDIFVSQDYTKVRRIKEEDKEKVELAESIRLKKELAMKMGKHGFGEKNLKKEDFVTYFKKIADAKINRSYTAVYKKLKAFVGEGGKLTFQAFDEVRVADFVKHLTKEVSENTAGQYLVLISVAFNQAIREKITTQNPVKFLTREEKPPKTQSKREFLTFEELQKLNNTPFKGNQHIRAAFLFSCYSGLRISDIKCLTWSQIDQERTEMQLRQKKSAKEFLYLPLAVSAHQIIAGLPKPQFSDLVFWDLPRTEGHCNMLIRLWVAEAGIKKHIHWHCGRHTYACLLLAHGVDLYTVSKLLGHSTLSMTEIYGKIMDKTKKIAVEKLPELKF